MIRTLRSCARPSSLGRKSRDDAGQTDRSGAVERTRAPLHPMEGPYPTMHPGSWLASGAAAVASDRRRAPFLANAADHLDAPALGGTVVTGQIAPILSTATATSTMSTCSGPGRLNRTVDRDDRQPGHQPVRWQLRPQHPVHLQHRHERRQQGRPRLRRALRGADNSGDQKYASRSTPAAMPVTRGGPPSPGSEGQRSSATTRTTSRSGPASGPIRSSSTSSGSSGHDAAQDRHRCRRRRPRQHPDRLLRATSTPTRS